jgi:hypothetical protein
MKKLIIVLFVLNLFAFAANAQSNNEKIIGKWKYSVETDYSPTGGVLIFSEKDGKLKGEVAPDDGGLYPMTKVEMREDDTIYFELKPEYDVIKVALKIDGNKLKGTGSTYQGEFTVTGEKKEE